MNRVASFLYKVVTFSSEKLKKLRTIVFKDEKYFNLYFFGEKGMNKSLLLCKKKVPYKS